jgi:5'-nucleotidase
MNRPSRPTVGRARDTELLDIKIDIDGTSARWKEEFEHCLTVIYPEWTYADLLAYDVRDRYNAPLWAIEEALNSIGYLTLEPMPMVKVAIVQMTQAGHKVTFATAPTLTHPTCEADKREWIARHFNDRMAEEAIIQVDKTTVDGDILIDDHPNIVGANPSPVWEHVQFLRAYNRSAARAAGRRGFSAWSQWAAVLGEVA